MDSELNSPSGITAVSTELLVADRGNHRILSYSFAIALMDGDSGAEIGQDPAPAKLVANRGGSPDRDTLSAPERLETMDNGATVYSDRCRHRK